MIILDLRQYPTDSDGAPIGRHTLVLPGVMTDALQIRRAYMSESRPSLVDVAASARKLAEMAVLESTLRDADAVLIGGPCYMMRAVEDALLAVGLVPVYPYRDAAGKLSGVVQCSGGAA